jgi:hypothetical protein
MPNIIAELPDVYSDNRLIFAGTIAKLAGNLHSSILVINSLHCGMQIFVIVTFGCKILIFFARWCSPQEFSLLLPKSRAQARDPYGYDISEGCASGTLNPRSYRDPSLPFGISEKALLSF